jgi:N-acetylneuraminic acid mutarotase
VDDQYALVEIFEPASGVLIPAAPLNTRRHEHSATLLPDGRVLVVGGYNAQQQWLVDAEVYDPLADTWTVTSPVYPHGVQHTATLLPDGRVLVVGGCIGSGICTNQVELFDPQTNAWTEAAPLASDLGSHAAVLLDDGRVLVAGGAGSTGAAAGGVGQVYDPLTNIWTVTGPMVLGRAQAPMIKLLDGRVLAASGISISGSPIALSSVEIYDPATNNWTEAASLAQPRYAHNLAMLADGQVLALGGAHEYDYPGGNPWTADSFIRSLKARSWDGPRYNAGELAQPEAYAATVPCLMVGWVTGGGAGSDMAKVWAETR